MQRRGHLVVAVVASVALVLQFWLVWQGHAVLDDVDPPGRGERVLRFFGYFTILSNLLVAGASWSIAASSDPLTSRLGRVLYVDAVVGITVTGIVHWVLLRPLLSLDGADWWADKLLHVAVPVLAVAAWLVVGPRGRVRAADVGWAVVPPVVWLGYTLARGAVTGFYPYPFLNADNHGYPTVLATCVGVAALFLALAFGASRLDRVLARRVSAPRS
ncbi:Pr6Pr family membrane protein [Nocardioides jejuensis]|uniref:F420-dependent oxidoreductase n=1 Tax=Nocardioides jejuensis TaxID=2502782 RepID=A0A4R1CIS2_9ACTN|nr:Pr6Pr family membrane protein [Nocardioides jejuensis]TCJ29858.1 hypothetical protein EPD65_06020 [Nocardioides jejuensis]